ncbi:MAG TPA: dTDP-4-dehydrorhamnose reductase [Candidatus Acidoferrales bacterium]|nr:dTDP-4-dehydrorhamnose reductase [Candidatus Acidoferrales bacterium]
MTIAVIGANGQLGSDLVAAFSDTGEAVRALTHADIEITDPSSVSSVLEQIQPQVIVNTAAMHHVENCEREPEKAFAVNAIGAKNLAAEARRLGAVLMHVSTDYVFDGSKGSPYVEEDAPRPLNVYGITKVAGEHFVRSTTEKHFVIRSSGLYGHSPCRAKGGLNFIELMLKLAKERGEVRVVDSEFVTPTSTAELARQIVQLSRSDCYGLYHATAEGSCSWFGFAQEIFALTDTPVRLKVAAPGEFPAKVARPSYSVLENRALKNIGLNEFKPWQDALRDYLGSRIRSSSAQICK